MSTSVQGSQPKQGFRFRGSFDVECANWDEFCVGATCDGSRTRVWYDVDAMIGYMRVRGGVWLSHAGGVYDSLLVADRLDRAGVKWSADTSQHRVTRLVGGGFAARDSYSLIPMAMDEAVPMLGRPAARLPWGCECGKDCGGFCQIRRRAKDGDPDLEDYVKADARDLFELVEHVQAHADKYGIDLRGTLGSTAWHTAKKALDLPDSDLPWHVWRNVRRADKGGRTMIIRPFAKGPGAHHDIVSAYPAALARASLPVGDWAELGTRRARAAFAIATPGIYCVTVRVPEDCFLPPLPLRLGRRVVYPTGSFSGSWALPELAAALDRGCEIVEIISAVCWEAESTLFRDLMHEWYEVRCAVGRKSPLGQWQSRLAKALPGKFAELPARTRVLAHPTSVKICLREGSCRDGCTKRCGAYDQLDVLGNFWEAPYWKLSPSGHAHWSAYVRAHTRIQLLEQADRFGRDLVYTATDSLWTLGRKRPRPVGARLGDWEYKHGWRDWECRAPGTYRVFDTDHDAWILRAAGSPGVKLSDWERGFAEEDRGVKTLRQAISSRGLSTDGLFTRKHRSWTLPASDREDGWYGDRKLDPQSGVTYPVDVHGHRERQRVRQERSRQGRTARVFAA